MIYNNCFHDSDDAHLSWGIDLDDSDPLHL